MSAPLDDMADFRRQVPEWGDMPDEVVVKTLAYQGWLANRRVRELGRLLAEELRIPSLIASLIAWLGRRFKGKERG